VQDAAEADEAAAEVLESVLEVHGLAGGGRIWKKGLKKSSFPFRGSMI
jgi:hypothetical protein